MILEPGATLVREAGAIVSTVLDVVQSDGKEIVILDTTVNHKSSQMLLQQLQTDGIGTFWQGEVALQAISLANTRSMYRLG